MYQQIHFVGKHTHARMHIQTQKHTHASPSIPLSACKILLFNHANVDPAYAVTFHVRAIDNLSACSTLPRPGMKRPFLLGSAVNCVCRMRNGPLQGRLKWTRHPGQFLSVLPQTVRTDSRAEPCDQLNASLNVGGIGTPLA